MTGDTATATPDYKDTLLLPQTDFPMRAGLPKREPEWLERWERIGVYERLREKEGREEFELHDGPPYANGNLHIGHALNKILKDMVVRSAQMRGFNSRYIPGWDCHGLPIEWKIEEQYRKKGQNKDEVPINDLRAECRAFAEHWIGVQREEFKRLGVIGEWENPYLTMDYDAEAVIAEDFMKFLMNGSLYQGSKPVMWSPIEKTALAEAEVEYHEHQSHTIWVKFPVVEFRSNIAEVHEESIPELALEDRRVADLLKKAKIVIWTTTPWTIPQNRAISFNPTIEYGLYRVTDAPEDNWAKTGELLLLADKLAEEVMTQARVDAWERVREVNKTELNAITCAHPFRGLADAAEKEENRWDYPVPLIAGDHVTDDAGTGFVHTAPSHGADDYQVFIDNRAFHPSMKMTHNVLEAGEFRADLPFFGGLYILDRKGKDGKANKAVIDKLVECGALLARGRLTHSYPHSWRSKAPLIFRNTPQWFVAIDHQLDDGMGEFGDTIRERALTSIDKLVKWYPQAGRNRLHSMIASRPDWVLSRQRAWGVPLTCFTKKGALPSDPDFLLKDETVNARIVQAFRDEGADAWFAEGAKERFLGNDYNPEEWEQVTDILDVWFDSGTTHAFTLRDREHKWPASLYLEGTDQHRGWFHSSMLQACGTRGRAPYEGVLTHGFTLDEKGMKMSKSQMNAMSPNKVVEQYGADIMRLWVAQADYTDDQRIGPEILKGTADSYRRLRNTLRFMLGALGTAEAPEPAELPELERLILHRLAELDGEVRRGYEGYDFQAVIQKLFAFMTTELSAFYFDIRKDSLYCDAIDDPRRQACLFVMQALFDRLTTWLAPILCFTMEEVWLTRNPGDQSSVHLEDFPETPAAWRDEALAEKWADIRAARRVVNGALELARRDKVIGSSLEAAPKLYVPTADLANLLRGVELADICITSGIDVIEGKSPEDAFKLDDSGLAVIFAKAQGAKCARCWKILPDVGSHEHPDTCSRCDRVLSS